MKMCDPHLCDPPPPKKKLSPLCKLSKRGVIKQNVREHGPTVNSCRSVFQLRRRHVEAGVTQQ